MHVLRGRHTHIEGKSAAFGNRDRTWIKLECDIGVSGSLCRRHCLRGFARLWICDSLRRMAQMYGIRRAYVDRPYVELVHVIAPNDMRNHGKHDFVVHHLRVLLPEQILQNWYLRQPGKAAESLHILLLQHSTK